MNTKALQTLSAIAISSLAVGSAAMASSFTIFSTGQAAQGSADPNYTIIEAAGTTLITPATAFVTKAGFPIDGTHWQADTGTSSWISPRPSYTSNQTDAPGVYGYQTTFNLAINAGTVQTLTGSWSVDNTFDGIYLNGHLLAGTIGGGSFKTFSSFTAPSADFVNGINTLDFFVINGAGATNNPTGLNAFASGTQTIVPEPSTVVVYTLGSLALLGFVVRKKRIS